MKQVQNEGEIHRNSKDESAFNNRLEAPFGSIIHKIFRKILKTTITVITEDMNYFHLFPVKRCFLPGSGEY